MTKVKNLIIGAGISGLTLANYIDDYIIIEKDNEVGGYCKTHYVDDFIWDYAGHFFHFQTDEFKRKFINDLNADEYISKDKKTYIYYDEKLIDYPFQMNIHQLSKEKFIDCLYDLYNKKEKEKYNNFLDMLYGKFGKSITEMFLKPYNEKLYACDLTNLDTDAMGRFFPYADLKEIINNMKKEKDHSYNSKFLYPKKGAMAIINVLMENIDQKKIRLNSQVTQINPLNKIAILNNGETIEYENLINTIPFNQFLKTFNEKNYNKLSEQLTYNKVLVFNLGFNKKSKYNKEHWIYFPGKENFYRIGFYDNILNKDKLSIYVEIGYAKDKVINEKEISLQLKQTLSNLKKIGIINETFKLLNHEHIVMNPAYVHINTKTDSEVKNVMKTMSEQKIYNIGRYGRWTYCSMEDCMIMAKELSQKL